VRIISGKYRGKRINAPKNIKARPTTDYAKEALFNILGNRYDLEGLVVLDLFAGIGSISMEFASRGAETVLSVDIAQNSYAFIKRMANELQLPIQVIKSDAFAYIKRHHMPCDIVFCDPPYDLERRGELPSMILDQDFIAEDGVLIIEHDEYTNYQMAPGFVETRNYGKVNFSFFEPTPK